MVITSMLGASAPAAELPAGQPPVSCLVSNPTTDHRSAGEHFSNFSS
jgi:hypothetical protein